MPDKRHRRVPFAGADALIAAAERDRARAIESRCQACNGKGYGPLSDHPGVPCPDCKGTGKRRKGSRP